MMEDKAISNHSLFTNIAERDKSLIGADKEMGQHIKHSTCTAARTGSGADIFANERISRLLLRLAPPVMAAQLIQAMYNIVDSFFVGMYSPSALTALSVIYPIQWLAPAIALGIGVGVNTYMSKLYAVKNEARADRTAGTGTALEVAAWTIYAACVLIFLPAYTRASANGSDVIRDTMIYGRIVCAGSIFQFLESNWAKVHQARGNMKTPMIAESLGALTNIIMDPLLIFGAGPIPSLGAAGAAYATVLGQFVSAVITCRKACHKIPSIHELPKFAVPSLKLGYPTILSQMTMSVYIVILNMILARFSDSAVTVLGLYYKYQSFFFIPLMGLCTCIVPILSYNHTTGDYRRCRMTMRDSILISAAFMLAGIFCFDAIPEKLLSLFSKEQEVLDAGIPAFRAIGLSFIPAVFSLMLPVFFQAIGESSKSTMLALCRQIFCLIPSFYLLSLIGLRWTWFAFPFSETLTGAVGLIMYFTEIRKWSRKSSICQL